MSPLREDTRRLHLREPEAQAALLVWAVEREDPAGHLLPEETRREATRRARAAEGEGWVSARALDLERALAAEHPSAARFQRWTNPVRGMAVPVLLVAFALGLATNALGPEGRINVLAVPLLGLIAWNVLMLLLFFASRWLPLLPSASRGEAPRALAFFQGLARRLGRRLADRAPRGEAGSGEEVLGRALALYLKRFLPAVEGLASARARRLLHASALILVAGTVAGMYLRGLGVEYRTVWESTFLGEAAVERLLGWVLGPAAALLGVEVPGAAEVATGRRDEAALLIHLYAVTAALFVGLPRLGLVLWEGLRCLRLGRRLGVDLPEVYLRRILAAVEGEARRVEILPYSYLPSGRAMDRLRALLAAHFGPRADLFQGRQLEYGEAAAEAPEAEVRVLVFGLAQTPELEVHGDFAEGVRRGLGERGLLLAVVDSGPYRRRLGASGERRLAERRAAWDRVLAEAGLKPLHLDLDQDLGDEELSRLAAALWPTGEPVEASG